MTKRTDHYARALVDATYITDKLAEAEKRMMDARPYIVGGWVRRVPTTGLLWIEGEGQDPRVVADDDGMVEVLAPVPEVEVADEVSGAMEHLSAVVGSMHEAQHEYLFNDSPEDKHAAAALGEFHGPLMRAVERVAAALAADRGEA